MLTLGALAGLASILLFIAGMVFGITPLIFKSGSMSPTIDTGALAFARTVPASEVQVGDIVSVYDNQGSRITHRVETIDQQGNNLAIAQLRGDANSVTDPDAYVITEADRVFFSINRLGYVAVWLSGPSGFILGAIAVGGLLYIAFRPKKAGPPSGGGDPHIPVDGIESKHSSAERGNSRALKSIVVLATVGLGVASVANIGGTQAAFTGTATAGSISFTTAASFPTPPATLTCTGNGSSVTLNWPATAGQSFRVIVRNATNTAQAPLVRDVTGGTTTLTLADLPSGGILLSNTNYDVEVHGLSGTTMTPAYTGYRVSSSTLLILFSSMSCVSGPTSGTTAASALAARSALATETPTSSASTTATTVAGTATSAPTATTATPTSTTSASPTTATTTPGTTVPTTTTVPATTTTAAQTTTTTTTPSEVPIGTPVTTAGLSAQKLSTTTGAVVSVSNSSGAEVYRGAVDNDAELHWLTGTDQLYVITTSGVTVIDTSTGVWAESPSPSELPDEIKALVP